MKEINNNTYLVLASIRDKDNNLGLCKARGITKGDILKRCGLCESTVNRAIELLVACGFIKEAIKQVNRKAYYISEEGIEEIKRSNQNYV